MSLSASKVQVLDDIPVLYIHPYNRWYSKPFSPFRGEDTEEEEYSTTYR